jgi:hypothetical protein
MSGLMEREREIVELLRREPLTREKPPHASASVARTYAAIVTHYVTDPCSCTGAQAGS